MSVTPPHSAAHASTPAAPGFDAFAHVLQMLAAPLALLDGGGRFIHANAALQALLELPPEANQGLALTDMMDPAWRQNLLQQIKYLQKSGQATTWELSLRRAGDEPLKLQVYAIWLPQLALAALAFFDITQYHHDEMTLRKTLLEQQAILENAAVGILFSRDGVIVECNIRAAEMFGFARRDLVGQVSRVIFPSEQSHAELSVHAQPPLSQGLAFQTEWKLKRRDGGLFWCRLYARAIDPWHTEHGTIWIAEDINAHKQDEARLRNTLLEMQAIMANAPLAIGFHRDNRILRYNQRYAAMFGFYGDEGAGQVSEILYPSMEAFTQTALQALPLLRQGLPFQAQMEMRRQDGSLFWAQAMAYVVHADAPEQGTVWIFDDITSQREAQEARKHLLLEQQAILDNAPVGIMFTRAHQIQRCNPRLEQMLGQENGDLIGMSAAQIFVGDGYANARRAGQALLACGQAYENNEVEMRRADGSHFWASIRCKAVDAQRSEEGTIWILQDISEKRAEEQQLRRTLMELDAIMSNASVGIVFTKNRVITRFNHRFHEMYGYDERHLGMPGRNMYPSEEAYQKVGMQAAPLLSAGKPYQAELEMLRVDGTPIWTQLIGYVINPQDPGQGTVWILEDRTEARRNEQFLRNALLENRVILETAAIGIAVIEYGRTLHCNRRMEELFGYDTGELIGVSTLHFYASRAEWDAARDGARVDFAQGREHCCERLMVRRDGRSFWARLSGRAFDPSQPRGRSVWLVDDITERRAASQAVERSRDELELRVAERTAELAGANAKLQAEIIERRQIEQQMQHMAYHDSLTGLPNRALLADRLQRAMLACQRNQLRLAVMFIDLDRFKNINDTLGHFIGDQLLKEVAQRLLLAVRASDTVARLGGDEFVVLLPELQQAQEAGLVAQKIIDSLASHFLIEECELHISPSIGICLYPDDGDDVDTLMRHADAAMYHAKDSGRNNYQFFAQQMIQAAALQFDLESRLRGALAREEFVLHFQPIIDMASQEVRVLEVLLRWQRSDGVLVNPDHFIPIMEETGLIVPAGAWVMRRACLQMQEWIAAGHPALPLAVNLSPRQFMQRGLIESIGAILQETGLDPALLEFEITETALMQHGAHTLDILDQINRMGIRLSIDDFGTGYSSLAYLKRFPVNKLKIDRAFVKDLELSSDDRAIVSAIIALAKSLQLAVVAEGVEQAQQYDLLRQAGCDYAQGYLFARPLPAAALLQWLADYKSRLASTGV
ncbi:EAL domain-containing protein [Massilia sp. W12]|uniref:EAL domain-containing protein n=1 Tax=Massilia sp. W12 TaxID=3126507 RepID=UPI0030CF7495